MEIVGDSASIGIRSKNFTTFCKSLILNGNDFENESNFRPPGGDRSNSANAKFQGNATWLGGRENSGKGEDRIGMGENIEKSKGRRRKTPEIEVRQEDFKTVVKISMKESSSPEEEIRDGSSIVYENGRFVTGNQNGEVDFDRRDVEAIYENVNVSGGNCYENVTPLVRKMASEKPESGSRCDRVNGGDVRISKCESEKVKISIEREKTESERQLYENGYLYRNGRGNESKREGNKKGESETKSSFIEVNLRKAKATNGRNGIPMDENSSGDPFDSGTSSDVDTLPPFGQAKRENVRVTIKSFQGEDTRRTDDSGGHGRAESLTSSGLGVDSEESDDGESNISCDSLNGVELSHPQSEDHGYDTPNFEDEAPGSPEIVYENVMTGTDFVGGSGSGVDPDESYGELNGRICEKVRGVDEPTSPPNGCRRSSLRAAGSPEVGKVDADGRGEETDQKTLPENLLCDIRSRNVRLSSTHPNGKGKEEMKRFIAETVFKLDRSEPYLPPTTTKSVEDGNQGTGEDTCGDRKANGTCAIEVDADRFYEFHLSENCREQEKKGSEEETFAGIKDYLSREKASAITSAKGTIRGVRNRVKAGIATFLQMHENKSYRGKDAGKVVVYTTTMGIVRETYQKCLKVKQILRTLMVKFEERDVFMCSEAQEEIRDRMKSDSILVPQVFVEGQHIGDAETIERLNEMGELRTILKPYKSLDACSTCKVCGGYRLLPCSVCKGSKKSVHRNHFTAEFVSLKCMNCDRVGLAKCHAC